MKTRISLWKPHHFRYLFYGLLIVLVFSSCENPDKGVCSNLIGELKNEVKQQYPYQENVKSLVFQNELKETFKFEMTEFIDEMGDYESDRYNLSREYYGHQFYNTKLDMFLTLRMRGSHNVVSCPDTAHAVNNLVINTPFEHTRDIGEPEIEFPLIMFLYIEGSGVIKPSQGSNAFTVNDTTYNNVYFDNHESSASLRPYFSFEDGVVAIVNKDGSLSLNLVEVEY